MVLFNKASAGIADKLPANKMPFGTFFSIFLFEKNSAQIWALQSAYKFVHTHALKAVPNVTAVEMSE